MLTVEFDRLKLERGARILDLGCGEGRHALGLRFTHADAEIIGIDLDFKSLSTAINRLPDIDKFIGEKQEKNICQFIQADGSKLPFGSNSFDAIICSEVLEHIEAYPLFLTEIKRILKPDGKLVISVPRQWPERVCWSLSTEYYSVPGGHVRIFNSRKLKQEIVDCGFQYKSLHWAHALHVPYWWLRCLLWRQGENQWLVRQYHKLLVWDLMNNPWLTKTIEKILNPIMGKSIVMYFDNKL